MFAYDFLKDNPRRNADMLANNWTELFRDPECTELIKHELLDMQAIGAKICDATLFFHKRQLEYELTHIPTRHNKTRKPQCIKEGSGSPLLHDKVLTYLYSWQLNMQDDGLSAGLVTEIYYDIPLWVLELPWTYNDINSLCVAYMRRHDVCTAVFEAFAKTVTRENMANYGYHIHGSLLHSIHTLFRYMSVDFIRTANIQQINTVVELSADVDLPLPDVRYTSLNEIQANHDERTLRMVQVQLSRVKGNRFTYTDTFINIIEDCGFVLPKNRGDMIKRGTSHSNCVATYADKQMKDIDSYREDGYGERRVSRLVFDDNATCELQFVLAHGFVVAVNVQQYKGRHNKDVTRPLALAKLRIELTGLPVEALAVKEYNE